MQENDLINKNAVIEGTIFDCFQIDKLLKTSSNSGIY